MCYTCNQVEFVHSGRPAEACLPDDCGARSRVGGVGDAEAPHDAIGAERLQVHKHW